MERAVSGRAVEGRDVECAVEGRDSLPLLSFMGGTLSLQRTLARVRVMRGYGSESELDELTLLIP